MGLLEEKKYHWSELEEYQEAFVIMAHAAAFKTKDILIMKRLFDLGNPYVIIGENGEGTYCRIAPESVDVMDVITKNYLK